MGLTFALEFPAVNDLSIDHEEITVTQVGGTALTYAGTLAGFAGGEVTDPSFVGNDGDAIQGTVTTVGKNGQKTVTSFSVPLTDTLAPAPSDAPSVKVLART